MIGIVLIEYLYDQFVVISIHVTLRSVSDLLTSIDRNLTVLLVPGLLRIKGSRPDKIDMLDQLLERAGLVEGKLQCLRDAAVIPALNGRIPLMELLPHDISAL